ncbi:hypothetical protein RchiOBHm_Chr2g0104871 [Rosa chinensis]|uniref:Uncharacterized protein n=1 Tax=Rosa chinensis TaxID=74649 RepID=A0A2P6RNF0_ROSCH|nr:hypothetical protein RchiOBHm_Chr2g0104871 [Rosa chinensis]
MRCPVLCIVLSTIMRLLHLGRALLPLTLLHRHLLDEMDPSFDQDYERPLGCLKA